jgi:hypothetical protein
VLGGLEVRRGLLTNDYNASVLVGALFSMLEHFGGPKREGAFSERAKHIERAYFITTYFGERKLSPVRLSPLCRSAFIHSSPSHMLNVVLPPHQQIRIKLPAHGPS